MNNLWMSSFFTLLLLGKTVLEILFFFHSYWVHNWKAEFQISANSRASSLYFLSFHMQKYKLRSVFALNTRPRLFKSQGNHFRFTWKNPGRGIEMVIFNLQLALLAIIRMLFWAAKNLVHPSIRFLISIPVSVRLFNDASISESLLINQFQH